MRLSIRRRVFVVLVAGLSCLALAPVGAAKAAAPEKPSRAESAA